MADHPPTVARPVDATGPHPFASFYDDLDGTLAEAWRMLARAVVDRKSPLHTPAVATTGIDGTPQVRTVVLRGVNVGLREVRFHTDRRSGKFAEISRDPRVAVLGYDAGHKIQLRLAGRARLHAGDDDIIAAEAWARSQARSRLCYRQPLAPGAAMSAGAVDGEQLASGFENFVVAVVVVEALEWLYLAHAGHRRARFNWDTAGTMTATWLAP
jgi:hypothetical protein